MKKFLASLVIGTMLSTSFPLFAEGPKLETPALIDGENDVGEAVSPMKKGQKAPFTGVLLSPRAAAKITVEMNNIDEKIDLAVKRTSEEDAARCTAKINEANINSDADKKILQARLDASLKNNDTLINRINKEEKNRPNVWFWASAGAASGVLTTILIVVSVNAAKK
jgi:hypothetical protein